MEFYQQTWYDTVSSKDKLTWIVFCVPNSGQQFSYSDADSIGRTERYLNFFLVICAYKFIMFFFSIWTCCKNKTVLPIISLHLLLYCGSQCAAQSFLTQDPAETVSPSGTTTLIRRCALASTMADAQEMITDLTVRRPVWRFAAG